MERFGKVLAAGLASVVLASTAVVGGVAVGAAAFIAVRWILALAL